MFTKKYLNTEMSPFFTGKILPNPTHCRFRNLFAIACLENGAYERLNTADLADNDLVVVVVTSQVGQDTS
jgi:hypothetical protein